ncbi:hypothetical protein, partial [Pseudophaeobacter flagellatus]|uniref:hypothetical protein n=1 Tax=Pseudophaeobacter flagellatus TaxID=2899119 RepID=UPI001E325FD5
MRRSALGNLLRACSKAFAAPWSTAQNREKSLDHKEQSLFNGAAIRRYTGDKINKQASGAQMMIFFRERLAVLAVPKTGTSSLEKALDPKASATFRGPPQLKHTRAREFETNFRSLFEKKGLPPIETMAVMREPIQWLGSWFRYRQRPSLQGHPKSTAGVSFNDFVAAYLTEGRPAYANIAQQADFITDKNGALLVDHLYSYSDLPAALQFLEKRLQQTITLPLVNKSPQKASQD